MQRSASGEIYAASKAVAAGEEIELVTIKPLQHYDVICWWSADDEVRWSRSFASEADAIAEYNRWAANKETPTS